MRKHSRVISLFSIPIALTCVFALMPLDAVAAKQCKKNCKNEKCKKEKCNESGGSEGSTAQASSAAAQSTSSAAQLSTSASESSTAVQSGRSAGVITEATTQPISSTAEPTSSTAQPMNSTTEPTTYTAQSTSSTAQSTNSTVELAKGVEMKSAHEHASDETIYHRQTGGFMYRDRQVTVKLSDLPKNEAEKLRKLIADSGILKQANVNVQNPGAADVIKYTFEVHHEGKVSRAVFDDSTMPESYQPLTKFLNPKLQNVPQTKP